LSKNSHSFCIVQELDDSKNIFVIDAINRGVSEGCAVILASEANPGEIIEMLEKKGLLDARKYISRGTLTILDKDFVYSIAETGLDAGRLLNRWFSLISKVKEKSGCQGIVAIGTAKVFFDTHNLEKLMAYEGRIGRRFDNIPIDAVCCFDADSFSKLALKNIIHFLNYHEYTIYQGGVYLQWHPHMILAIINKAIDDALSPGTYKLLLKTLELVYHIDSDRIVSQPELFEDKLRKMLGKTADMTLDRIKKEITTELLYLRNTGKMP
jgi:hypothetical protein